MVGTKDAPRIRFFSLAHGGEELLVLSIPAEASATAALTAAELEIARAIAAGATNAEIARRRGTSVRTVGNQVASILRRLEVDSRAQVAIKMALGDRAQNPTKATR
jgi:DNA-binding NarL/FixJ family response regulator